MRIIGVTGGIGSGKSTVSKVFKELGIPVYDADTEAKFLINNSDVIKKEFKSIFGDDIYIDDNQIDRKRLSKLIFNDKSLLDKVNSIVHPAVRSHFKAWAASQKTDLVIKEAAILFESGTYKDVDIVITVTAPEDERIERVCKRDNVSKEQVRKRIANQISDEEKIKKSDFIIKNAENDMIIPQVLKIFNLLTRISCY